MNLIIDVGNTFVKLAVFAKNDLLINQSVVHADALESVRKIIDFYPKLKKAIIASVGEEDKDLVKAIKKHIDLLHLTSETKLPFKNKYSTPKTLGVDRIVAEDLSVHLIATTGEFV